MSRALKVGDRLKDNDPRASARVLTIYHLATTAVYVRGAILRGIRIERRRIFTDGQARRHGFNRIPAEDTPA